MDRGNNEAIIPRHLAIIMDGNGRWARQRGLPRAAGHEAGVQAILRATEASVDLGIQFLTLYAFSTENWCRPKEEINFLMRLIEEFAMQELPDMQRNGVHLQLMGRREGLPTSLLDVLDDVCVQTSGNSRLTLSLALNYGGRSEIVDTMKAVMVDYREKEMDVHEIDETFFSHHLYCPGTPDADMVVRTSGEWRLSNFLLWRSAYAVFLSIPVLWPDFNKKNLMEVIKVYSEQKSGQNID